MLASALQSLKRERREPKVGICGGTTRRLMSFVAFVLKLSMTKKKGCSHVYQLELNPMTNTERALAAAASSHLSAGRPLRRRRRCQSRRPAADADGVERL